MSSWTKKNNNIITLLDIIPGLEAALSVTIKKWKSERI
jgi:hypothetical protein